MHGSLQAGLPGPGCEGLGRRVRPGLWSCAGKGQSEQPEGHLKHPGDRAASPVALGWVWGPGQWLQCRRALCGVAAGRGSWVSLGPGAWLLVTRPPWAPAYGGAAVPGDSGGQSQVGSSGPTPLPVFHWVKAGLSRLSSLCL